MACVTCGRGFHRECSKCKKGKCHKDEPNRGGTPESLEGEERDEKVSSAPKKRKSARENLKDPKSTGRKRAAELYPLDSNAACEWRGLRNCGGGRRPIIGCLNGTQKHRHHGPVKETTRNELGNVHRICSACHVRWHELNDLVYVERDYNLMPHQPLPATEADIIQNELDWKSGKMGRLFELASSKNQEKHRASQNILPAHGSSEDELGLDYSLPQSVDEET